MRDLSKVQLSQMFFDKYVNLNDRQRDEFSTLCNKLLNENFIYGQIASDKDIYYKILVYRDIMEDYFLLIDLKLVHDDTRKIVYIEGDQRMKIRLKKMDTILLIILRKLYYTKSKEVVDTSINITITYDDLIEELNRTNIYKNKLLKTQLLESLQKLKKYKLINLDTINYEENNVIEIYPMITIIVNINTLDLLDEKLNSYIAENGDDEDETNKN